MRVLITRPRADAEPLARLLAERGLVPLVEPLLDIRPLATPLPDLAPMQAVLFTSANGVRAFAAACARRDIRVLAVGAHTAEAATAAGFADCTAAGGDVASLADLAASRLDPGGGRLLHAAGAAVAGDHAASLQSLGFTVERVALYEAVAARALSPATRSAIAGDEVGFALFFSPRTAQSFVSLALAADLAGACRRIVGVCLSPAVAQALAGLVLRDVVVADQPNSAALLAAVDRRLGGDQAE